MSWPSRAWPENWLSFDSGAGEGPAAYLEGDPRHATFVAAVTEDEVIGWIHLSEVHCSRASPTRKSRIS